MGGFWRDVLPKGIYGALSRVEDKNKTFPQQSGIMALQFGWDINQDNKAISAAVYHIVHYTRRNIEYAIRRSIGRTLGSLCIRR